MKISFFDKLKMVFQRIGWKFVVKRIISAILSILVITTIIFFMIRAAPGGPFAMEREVTEAVKQNLNKKYHLDESLFQQYMRYMGDLLFKFDFGPSFKYPSKSVNEIIADSLPTSFSIGFFAIALSFIVGVFSGLISALKQNSFWDYFFMSFALLGISTPLFVITPLLIILFATKLHILPTAGWGEWYHYIIPVISLALPRTAYITRMAKSGILENIRKDFVMTARSKGLSERVILTRHVLKGSLIPVVSYVGPAFAMVVTGSMVVEQIIGINGMGRFYVQAAINRDYTLIAGVMITFAALLILMNLIVDIAYAFLDPRTKYN